MTYQLRDAPAALYAIALLLLSPGCAGLLRAVGDDDQPTVRPACVATYAQLTPNAQLGADGCGNLWLRVSAPDGSAGCMVLSDDGQSMLRIECPAQGDTLAVAR